MLRFIAASVLVMHLLFMLFFTVSGRLLSISVAIVCCLVLLILYFRKGAFAPAVLTLLVLYCLALLVAYIALVIGSIQIGRPGNIWFHSVVFLPGIFSAFVYFRCILRDRGERQACV